MKNNDDDQEDKEVVRSSSSRGDSYDRLTMALGVILAILLCALMILMVLLMIYSAQAEDESQEAAHQRSIHGQQIELAIERTAGTGLPWYEAMQVPSQCLVQKILRWEVKHGYRPSVPVFAQ